MEKRTSDLRKRTSDLEDWNSDRNSFRTERKRTSDLEIGRPVFKHAETFVFPCGKTDVRFWETDVWNWEGREPIFSLIENGRPILENRTSDFEPTETCLLTDTNRTSDFTNRTTDSVGPVFPSFEESVVDLRGTFLNPWRTHLDGQDATRLSLMVGLWAGV